MFWLKKTVSSILMPFPIFLFFCALALFFFYRNRRQKGLLFSIIAIAWITLLSYPPVPAMILIPLEYRCNALTETEKMGETVYIHVLGSGHVSNSNLPLSSQIENTSIARIIEGISLYQRKEGMKLIFSGYGGNDPIPNGKMNSNLAIALGVDPKDIIVLEAPRDTAEEAKEVHTILKDNPVILVTSASHMVRASMLFRSEGINVIPAPTDYLVKKDPEWDQFPSGYGLRMSEVVFHEYLGLAWGTLMRTIATFKS